jgi:hypothetical protein
MTFHVMLEERQVFDALPDRLIAEGRYTATTDEMLPRYFDQLKAP